MRERLRHCREEFHNSDIGERVLCAGGKVLECGAAMLEGEEWIAAIDLCGCTLEVRCCDDTVTLQVRC